MTFFSISKLLLRMRSKEAVAQHLRLVFKENVKNI